MARKLIFAVVIVLLIAGGVAGWYRYRMKQVNFTFSLWVQSLNFSRVIIESDGRQVYDSTSSNTVFQVKAPGRPQRSYGPEMLPQVKIKLLYPCGWKTIDVKIKDKLDDPNLVQKMKTGAITVYADVEVKDAPKDDVTILVDNRDHAATSISIGQVVHDVPVNEKGKGYKFAYQPECDEGRKVLVGGELAGELPKEIKDIDANSDYDMNDSKYSHNFLVDTSGKRCYSYNDHCYNPKGSDACIFGSGDAKTYRKRILHHIAMNEPDFFLEEVPKKITVDKTWSLDFEIKYSLKQISCDWD